jgi:hypothetical protein
MRAPQPTLHRLETSTLHLKMDIKRQYGINMRRSLQSNLLPKQISTFTAAKAAAAPQNNCVKKSGKCFQCSPDPVSYERGLQEQAVRN